jgi:hypothetical protein
MATSIFMSTLADTERRHRRLSAVIDNIPPVCSAHHNPVMVMPVAAHYARGRWR